MMKKCLFVFILTILAVTSIVACSAETNPEETSQAVTEKGNTTDISGESNTTISVNGTFIPGEVLLTIPLYPGSIPTTFLDLRGDGGPPSITCNNPMYDGPGRPGYQSASVQYTANATAKQVFSWYQNELTAMGYETNGRGESGSRKLSKYDGAFYLPSQPFVSVEIHAYQLYVGSGPNMVYELLVVNSVPLPKPDKAAIPSDIDTISLTWYGQYGDPEINKTITDQQDIRQLVEIVNSLIVKPDYSFSGMSGPVNEIIFRMVFHSGSAGDTTVTSVTNRGYENGIHVDEYPILWDAQNSLSAKVQELAQTKRSIY